MSEREGDPLGGYKRKCALPTCRKEFYCRGGWGYKIGEDKQVKCYCSYKHMRQAQAEMEAKQKQSQEQKRKNHGGGKNAQAQDHGAGRSGDVQAVQGGRKGVQGRHGDGDQYKCRLLSVHEVEGGGRTENGRVQWVRVQGK